MATTPYQYVTSLGVIIPDTSAILTDVQDEYKTVFGNDLVVTADTPQGVLITAEALARDEVVNNNAVVSNNLNPNVAPGVFLDAIMALTGMQRIGATKTQVADVALTGVAGTVISQGTQASTAAGDIFETLSAVTLALDGTATVNFAAVQYGAIPCDVGELTQVVTNVLGWETVTNPNAGVLGQSTQSDQAARAMRKNTLGFQGVALPVAITSALYATEGVKSLWFQENVENTTQSINGISMVAKSVYACVDGGSDTDVAAALLENKSSGAAWNGSTTVNVIEPASGQTYAVKFDRPTEVSIITRITTTNGNIADIKQAVLAYVAGNINGLAGLVVGADVSPFEISAAIVSQFPSFYIKKVEISLSTPVSYSTNDIAIAVDEIATIDESGISVVIA